jgi:SAM-dependent methyltransferase
MTSPSPYSQAMLDYWRGDAVAAYTIHRDDGWSQPVPVAPAFTGPPFHPIEQVALDRAAGRVLDVGAGVGRHSLALQGRLAQVTAIEVEPELVNIMSERGVRDAVTANVLTLATREFDTILMLMNGFGLVGTLSGAAAFFQHARNLLSFTGQILCDSMDVRQTSNATHLAYQETNRRDGRPAGQMRFAIEYRGCRGEAFDWLHLDFDTLREHAQRHGWLAEKLAQDENGRYLARLVLSQ